MDDLLDAAKDRLKTHYFGYVFAAFLLINWKELFFIFVSNDTPLERIAYFENGTSWWGLVFAPLLLGVITSVAAAWLKWILHDVYAHPAEQISISDIESKSRMLSKSAELEHSRNTLLAEQQQSVVDSANKRDQVEKIENPKIKAEAQLELAEKSLLQTQGLDDREANRALKRIAEAHRTLSDIAYQFDDMEKAESHTNKALEIETNLLQKSNVLNISDGALQLLRQIANNENEAPVLTIQQTDELGERAGLPPNSINTLLKELHNVGIVKISPSGKEVHLDKFDINEFWRQYATKPA